METLEAVNLLNDYAVACKEARHFHAGKVALKRAIAIHPNASVLWANLGVVLWNLNEVEEAEQALLHSIELTKNHETETIVANPWANLGLLQASLQRFEEAEETLRYAMARETERLNPTWDLACSLLEKGDWEQGLELYEVRKEYKKFPKHPYPDWKGEDLNDKTIYIQAEQGIGDRILFSRYLYWLHTKYPKVKIILLVDAPTVSLMWEFKEFVEFLPVNVPYPKADYGMYMMSLPKFHGSRPDNIPLDPGLIAKRVLRMPERCNLPEPHLPSLKVGIAWTGNPQQDLNLFRSIPFEKMLTFADSPKVTLYSLQVKDGADDVHKFGADQLVCDLSKDLEEKSFLGTAQVIMALDLVITCCTSTAHLAGTLGVPCWTLLCSNPYWVWLTGRSDSIWYPKMKLYRQTVPGKWDDVINTVRHDLFQLADQKIK